MWFILYCFLVYLWVTKTNWVDSGTWTCHLQINISVLYQLSHLALCRRYPLFRSDTSLRQWRRLHPCALVIALVPLKCFSRNLQFPYRVPFTMEKMPRCPCPFKNEAFKSHILTNFKVHAVILLSPMHHPRLDRFVFTIQKLSPVHQI